MGNGHRTSATFVNMFKAVGLISLAWLSQRIFTLLADHFTRSTQRRNYLTIDRAVPKYFSHSLVTILLLMAALLDSFLSTAYQWRWRLPAVLPQTFSMLDSSMHEPELSPLLGNRFSTQAPAEYQALDPKSQSSWAPTSNLFL
jgi:uncharacterized membrane protein